MLGNSHNQTSNNPHRRAEELFSFLNKEKFLKRKCAQNFHGRLIWHEGEADFKSLDAEVNKIFPERVEYLPQKYLERICSNIADDEFRATLNEVIFRYVKPEQRFDQSSLDGLIKYLTQQVDINLQSSKSDLHQVNERVVSIEKKLVPDYVKEIEERIRLKKEELAAHQKAVPTEIPKPLDESEDSNAVEAKEIENLAQEIDVCTKKIEQLQNEQTEIAKFVEELHQFKQAIEREAGRLTNLELQYQIVLESAGLAFKDIVKLRLDYSELEVLVNQKDRRLKEIEISLTTQEQIAEKFGEGVEAQAARVQAESKSIDCKRANLEIKKVQLVERMAKPEREYQEYLKELSSWEVRKKEIFGDELCPVVDSLKGLERELELINTTYPNDLEYAKSNQIRVSKEIFRKKRSLTQFYDEIKQSIDAEITKFRENLGDYSLSIEAGLRFDSSFIDNFLEYINQNVRGSFLWIGRRKSHDSGVL